jgi:hypothetical protein
MHLRQQLYRGATPFIHICVAVHAMRAAARH